DSPYDFTIIDMEHLEFDFPTLRHSLQYLPSRRRIAESGSLQPDVVPLVRVPPNAGELNQWVIKQTLDIGAYGIVLPHLSTVEQARAAVAAMRYPRPGDPEGKGRGMRGWYPRHAARYWGLSIRQYYEAVELWPVSPTGELFLMPIVEDRQGVKNLPAILKEVPGISAVWAGAGDLSVDLGHGANPKHPDVEAGVQAILRACLDHDVPCCTIADASDVERRLDQGFRIIVAAAPKSHEALERGRAHGGR
ncbi:MAG TPA: aldolase/citrate lyase family protein, partial [Dehalococcoidia bacterium]|nr:aldolase/citrate lyase family protein [Dehalococcoidia bacterium]